MADTLVTPPALPTWRRLAGCTAIALRHFAGDTSARDAAQALGLAWPAGPGELTGRGPWLAWLNPQEVFAFASEAAVLRALLPALAPGRHETAMAADLSEAVSVFELHGPHLNAWLARLADASAIPRGAGHVTRCRVADVAAVVLRPHENCIWLVVDRPLASYLHNWLAYAHQGAFGHSPDVAAVGPMDETVTSAQSKRTARPRDLGCSGLKRLI